MATKIWVKAGNGSFESKNSWNNDPMKGEVGPPGPDDGALFNTGGPHVVSMGGAKCRSISTFDDLTLNGSFTLTDGIGASGTKLVLGGGTARVGGLINADDLEFSGETVFGGSVLNSLSLKVSGSSFNLSGPFQGQFIGAGAVSVAGTDITALFVDFSGGGKIANTTILSRDDGSGAAGLGHFGVSGDYNLTNVTVQALTAELVDSVTMSGGTLQATSLTCGTHVTGAPGILFKSGATIATGSFADSSGSLNPTEIDLVNAAWTNEDTFETSGVLSLSNGARLTTGTFDVNPGRGAGADVSISDPTSRLDCSGDFTALKLVVEQGDVKIGGDATLVSGGNAVDGAGATLTVRGELTVSGPDALEIDDGAKVMAGRLDLPSEFTFVSIDDGSLLTASKAISGDGMISIGQDAVLDADGSVAKAVTVTFEARPTGARFEIGDLDKMNASIDHFARGAVIDIEGLGASAKFSVAHRGGDTIVRFTAGGVDLGELTFLDDFEKRDFRFNAGTGELKLAASSMLLADSDHLIVTDNLSTHLTDLADALIG